MLNAAWDFMKNGCLLREGYLRNLGGSAGLFGLNYNDTPLNSCKDITLVVLWKTGEIFYSKGSG